MMNAAVMTEPTTGYEPSTQGGGRLVWPEGRNLIDGESTIVDARVGNGAGEQGGVGCPQMPPSDQDRVVRAESPGAS